MKIAVVQHRLRETPSDDVEALVSAATRAADAGAAFVVFPEVPTLGPEGSAERERLYAALDALDGKRLIPGANGSDAGFTFVTPCVEGLADLGAVALLLGDTGFRGSEWVSALAQSPAVAIMCPRSENDMQAEAAFEVALALTDSLAGLVLLAECAGAPLGKPGHGGSAIIHLGAVLAEAGSDDDLLLAEVELPVAQPEPREPLPELPTIIAQRLSNHRGEKIAVDYPADLS